MRASTAAKVALTLAPAALFLGWIGGAGGLLVLAGLALVGALWCLIGGGVLSVSRDLDAIYAIRIARARRRDRDHSSTG